VTARRELVATVGVRTARQGLMMEMGRGPLWHPAGAVLAARLVGQMAGYADAADATRRDAEAAG
jgi:hypothetical protein